MLLLTKQFHDSFECLPIVPFTLQKKLGPDPLKSGPDQFFVSVYTFNNQVWLMIEKCNGTYARNHRKAKQAHMKKMVRNEGAFTQRFRTAKGVRTSFFFFFGFGAIAAYGRKPEKSESGFIS